MDYKLAISILSKKMGVLLRVARTRRGESKKSCGDVIGVSSLAAGHLTLVPKLQAELKKFKREDMLIVVGGVIPPDDFQKLYDMGVQAVFGPGTVIHQAAQELIEKLNKKFGYK